MTEFTDIECERNKFSKWTTISSTKKLLLIPLAILLGWGIGLWFEPTVLKLLGNESLIVTNKLFWILLSTCLIVCLFVLYTLLLKFHYRIALWEIVIICGLCSIYLTLKYHLIAENVHVLRIWNNLNASDLFFSIVISFTAGALATYLWPKTKRNENVFFEDRAPSNCDSNHKYIRLINKIKPAIFNDIYQGSFSIGIVAPWGVGKSTFISEVIYEIEQHQKKGEIAWKNDQIEKGIANSPSYQTIITISFSPFLNHNDELVIHEFFIELSNKLKSRSGKLSNKLISYSEKLANIAESGNLSILLSPIQESNKKGSVGELYNDIKELIYELDLKMVVLIDDLDRLSPKEILQVLKLIRNTSDFPNVVFIVALDKEYVIRALRSQGDFMDNHFIDKFFQLECHLPEVDNMDLLNFIIDSLNQKVKLPNSGFYFDFENDLRKEVVLLPYYVRNYRDAKRFINQLIFEHNLIQNLFREIAVKDYVNMLFLKIRFPSVYRDLCEKPSRFLNKNNDGIYTLIDKPEKENSPNNTMIDFDDLIFINDGAYIAPDLDRFKFDCTLEPKKCGEEFNQEESHLIKNTLYELFHKMDKTPYNSIKHERNFFKLISLRFKNDDLTSTDYDSLIDSLGNTDLIRLKIEQLIKEKKGSQLVNRFYFATIPSKEYLVEFCKMLFVALKFFRVNSAEYGKVNELILKRMSPNVSRNLVSETGVELNDLDRKMILDDSFVNQDFGLMDKVNFLTDIWRNDSNTETWGYKKGEFIQLLDKCLEKYLDQYVDQEWDKYDTSVFHFYWSIHEFEDLEPIKKRIRDHLKNGSLKVFCYQLIQPEVFSHSIFKINDLVQHIFGGYNELFVFIKDHLDSDLPEIKSFLEFLYLITRTGNKIFLKFHFHEKLILGPFLGWGDESEIERERIKPIIQLIIEHKSSEYVSVLPMDIDHKTKRSTFEMKFYSTLFGKTPNTTKENLISEYFNQLLQKLQLKHEGLTLQLNSTNNDKVAILHKNEVVVELISVVI